MITKKTLSFLSPCKGAFYTNNAHYLSFDCEGLLYFNNELIKVNYGDVICIPANVNIRYSLYSNGFGAVKIDVVGIRGFSTKEFQYSELTPLIGARKDLERCDLLSKDLLINLVNENIMMKILNYERNTGDVITKKIYGLIKDKPDYSWRLDDFCRILFLSRSSLGRKLKESNSNINTIINNARLDCSMDLIKNKNINLLSVSISCGFNSESYFCRKFKERFGLTPSEFRKTSFKK